MEKIILMTNDNKLLLSKDETSENIIKDLSLEIVEFDENQLIVKLRNDYKNEWNVIVVDDWFIVEDI